MKHLINGDIEAKTVRLVDTETKQADVISIADAIKRAEARELDLVQVADGNPPVVKLMDYSKFAYEQKKKLKEQKRKSRETAIEIKEVNFRPVTGDHDIMVKVKKIKKFLNKGAQVKLIVMYRGREMNRISDANDILSKVLEQVGDHNVVNGLAINGNKATIQIAQ